jgi:hypothetical protein
MKMLKKLINAVTKRNQEVDKVCSDFDKLQQKIMQQTQNIVQQSLDKR